MNNKKFIKQNLDFFKSLTFYLINEKGIRDGKNLILKHGTKHFLNVIAVQFPDSDFEKSLLTAFNISDEPLDQTNDIAKAVDLFLKKNNSNLFYKPPYF